MVYFCGHGHMVPQVDPGSRITCVKPKLESPRFSHHEFVLRCRPFALWRFAPRPTACGHIWRSLCGPAADTGSSTTVCQVCHENSKARKHALKLASTGVLTVCQRARLWRLRLYLNTTAAKRSRRPPSYGADGRSRDRYFHIPSLAPEKEFYQPHNQPHYEIPR